MGITIDTALGTYLDRIAHILKSQLHKVTDKQKIERFLAELSPTDDLSESQVEAILSPDYDLHGAPLLEQLAKLGDPSQFAFPIALQHTRTADVSFSGLESYFR